MKRQINPTRVNPKDLAEDYVNSTLTVKEILAKYKLSTTSMYIILANHFGSREKIPSRRGRDKKEFPVTTPVKKEDLLAAEAEAKIEDEEVTKETVDLEKLVDQMLSGLEKKDEDEENTTKEGVEEMLELSFAGSTFTDPALTRLYGARTIEVDMISDRHESGNRHAIFQGPLTDEQITDYAWQEETVKNYIRQHCTKICGENEEDSFYFERLVVVCSGLQMILTSLIKVCSSMKVSLTLKHWNPTERRYDSQAVTSFSGDMPGNMLFSRMNGELYLYDCSVSDIESILKENPDYHFPTVILNDHNEDTGAFERTVYIISINKKHMWDMYVKYVEAQQEAQTKHSVSACLLYQNKFGSLQFGDKLSRGYNFNSSNQRS